MIELLYVLLWFIEDKAPSDKEFNTYFSPFKD